MSPNAALAVVEALPASRPEHVSSDLLGPLAVARDAIFTFAEGVFGFPECRRFALLAAGRPGVYWLQSLEHGTLTFLLADPFRFVPGYSVELGDADQVELGAHEPADVAMLCIVTLPRTRDERPTANLQGPLAFNMRTQDARQLALGDARWGVRWALDLDQAAGEPAA